MSRAVPRPKALAVDAGDLPLDVRVSDRARRLTMRIDPAKGRVRVTVPDWVGPAEASRFVAHHAAWARLRLARLPAHTPFAEGMVIPIRGIDHTIRHRPASGRGTPPVACAAGEMVVTGGAEHLARRVRDYLVTQARADATALTYPLAKRVNRRVTGITVRDTRSRWGSCAASGKLNFCWRLILAPDWILAYVVAHEVAHLVELNHSPRFWAIVRDLCPEHRRARAWLKANGARLLRYG